MRRGNPAEARADPPAVLDRSTLGSCTLALQRIGASAPQDPLDLTRHLVGLQAQVPSTPALSLLARGAVGAGQALRALHVDRRLILKLWSLRTTVHLVPADLAATVLSATSAQWLDRYYRFVERRAGIDRRAMSAIERDTLAALSDRPMTRAELWTRVPRLATIPAASWGADVRGLAYRGLVAHGPARGQHATFVRVDRWLPGGALSLPEADAALADLARRYLAAYGPASDVDFAHWTGHRAKVARSALESLGDRAVTIHLEGNSRPLFALKEMMDGLRRLPAPPDVVFLPRFDPLLLAHREKSRFIDAGHHAAVFRQAAEVRAVVLLRGRVGATWRHERSSAGLTVEVSPLTRCPVAIRRRIAEEAARLRDHLAPGRRLAVRFE